MMVHGYETYIGGVPASSFNAECVSRNIAPATVITYSDWPRQSINPLNYGSAVQYKVIKLKFRFEYFTDEELLQYSGDLVNALRKCQLKFDNMKYYFDCTVSDSSLDQVDGGKQELTVTLNSSYAYLPAVTVSLAAQSQTVTAQGNLPSPAVVTLTPTQDIGAVTLTGLAKKPIKVSNLHAGAPVTIDAEACTVTEPDLDTVMTTAMGAGKWMMRKYMMPGMFSPDTMAADYIPTKATIPDNPSYTQQLISDASDIYQDNANNYLVHIKTGLYVASAKSITFQFYHDDGVSVYLNNAAVYQHAHAETDLPGNEGYPSVTLNLSAGWNTVEFILLNHFGEGGIWGITPDMASQVDQLSAYYARDASPTGTVNKFPDTDFWQFPRLQPSAQTVATDTPLGTCGVSISYKPKSM